MGTTNILDLNNRLTKVEKENVAQNSYTSLKNKPKINSVTLTGNKTLADIGAAAADDLTTLAGDVGDKTQLNTTDKSSTVAAINEVNSKLNKTSSQVNIDPTYYSNVGWDIVKQANICILNMRDLKDIPTGDIVVATIPEGFRPQLPFYEYVYLPNQNVHLGFRFEPDGKISTINNYGAAISGVAYCNRNICYFT